MTNESPALETTCAAVRDRLAAGEDLVLIDCREPNEHLIVCLESADRLPMSQWPQWSPRAHDWQDRPVVVYCHLGGRSLQVAMWLRELGVRQAQSMAGGIDQWAVEIDQSMPRY